MVEGFSVLSDYHYSIGATVGRVIALRGAVIPIAVGVNIGCGMLAIQTCFTSQDLTESLGSFRSTL